MTEASEHQEAVSKRTLAALFIYGVLVAILAQALRVVLQDTVPSQDVQVFPAGVTPPRQPPFPVMVAATTVVGLFYVCAAGAFLHRLHTQKATAPLK